jgi:hypothetical protein
MGGKLLETDTRRTPKPHSLIVEADPGSDPTGPAGESRMEIVATWRLLIQHAGHETVRARRDKRREKDRMRIARPESAAAILLAAAGLAGCAGPQPPAGASLIKFEVTDVQKGAAAPVIAENGGMMDFPVVFSINVRVVGNISPDARSLRVAASSYTPECNTGPGAETSPTRTMHPTKIIRFPYYVTFVPDTNSLVQTWPFSTATLTAVAGCPDPQEPWYPSTTPLAGTLFLHAEVQTADGNWWGSDLTFRIGNPQPGAAMAAQAGP